MQKSPKPNMSQKHYNSSFRKDQHEKLIDGSLNLMIMRQAVLKATSYSFFTLSISFSNPLG